MLRRKYVVIKEFAGLNEEMKVGDVLMVKLNRKAYKRMVTQFGVDVCDLGSHNGEVCCRKMGFFESIKATVSILYWKLVWLLCD